MSWNIIVPVVVSKSKTKSRQSTKSFEPEELWDDGKWVFVWWTLFNVLLFALQNSVT